MGATGSRRNGDLLLDAAACVVLLVAALALYSALFLYVPVLTEARDFLFSRGWGVSVGMMWVPSGSDVRPLSWRFFAWQRDQFGFNAEAVNIVQFVLLGLCAAAGYVHLRQLKLRRFQSLLASALWLLSLPALHAAFWQATQHDKLGFLVTITTLSVSLHAIRGHQTRTVPLFAIALLVLAVAAVASKPVAFVLAGLFVAQVMLFTPMKTLAGFSRAARVIALPALGLVIYAIVYAGRMSPQWRAHTTGGDVGRNLLVYLRNTANGDFDSSTPAAIALFAPIAVAWIWGAWRWSTRLLAPTKVDVGGTSTYDEPTRDAVLTYFAAIFVGCLILLSRGRFPASFYLLIPGFAFLASAAVLSTERRTWFVGVTVVVGLMLSSWTSTTGESRLAQWRQRARNLSDGYHRLHGTVIPEHVRVVTFVLPDQPEGDFYFFSDGNHTTIDPTIPSFLFRQQLTVPIRRLSKKPGSAHPGELVAIWSNDLRLVGAEFSKVTLMTAGDGTVYTPGKALSFRRGGDGVALLGEGWSQPEPHGTWSDGTDASLTLNLDRPYDTPLAIRMWAQPFTDRLHERQRVRLFANDDLVGEWTLADGSTSTFLEAIVPAPSAPSNRVDLRLHFLDPRTPASLGLSSDARRLGIALQSLSADSVRGQ